MSSSFDIHQFISGFAGGVAGLVVGHPFDTVKVRLQAQGTHGVKVMYRGSLSCFMSIIRTESVFGLYKGVVAPMVGFTTINTIVFGVHGNVLRLLDPQEGSMRFPSIWKSSLAGGVAGAVQSLVCSPMELIRIRMQMQGIGEMTQATLYQPSQSRVYHNSLECLVKTYRQGGLRGVYSGVVSTLWREVPSYMAYFAVWDYLCRTWSSDSSDSKHELAMYKVMSAGGFAGMAAWLISYPFDVVKTRIQIDGMGTREYNGIVDCFRKTVRTEGPGSLLKGLTPALLRAFPANAATFAALTTTMKYLKGY